jgi:histidine triad (HIT) family protein
MPSNDCIFCKIVSGDIPAQIVYRDEQVTAFQDLHPVAPVHILIVPNGHIASLGEVGPADAPALAGLLQTAATLAGQEDVAASGFRVVINAGPAAGQSVDHLHVHLLAGRDLSWPPG